MLLKLINEDRDFVSDYFTKMYAPFMISVAHAAPFFGPFCEARERPKFAHVPACSLKARSHVIATSQMVMLFFTFTSCISFLRTRGKCA